MLLKCYIRITIGCLRPYGFASIFDRFRESGWQTLIRFIFRSLSVLFLAQAVIFAVLDGARSVGASQLVFKPLLAMWERNAPESLMDVEAWVTQHLGERVWYSFAISVLQQPGWLIFGILALIAYLIGYKRERRFGRFEV